LGLGSYLRIFFWRGDVGLCCNSIKEGTMNTDTRHHAHALIDQLPPTKLAALETILESMLDPLSQKLARAPVDDEPFSEEDRRAIAEADAWSQHNTPIALETVLGDFGLTMVDWETLAKTPLVGEQSKPNG
jgi:hypothetical protein